MSRVPLVTHRCHSVCEVSVEMHNNVFYSAGGAVNLMRTVDAMWTTGSALIGGSNNWVVTGSQNVPTQWTGTIDGTSPGFASVARPERQVRLSTQAIRIRRAFRDIPSRSRFSRRRSFLRSIVP